MDALINLFELRESFFEFLEELSATINGKRKETGHRNTSPHLSISYML